VTALANTFLFFVLLPFISPLPTRADVQLPAFICGAAILAVDLVRGRIKLSAIEYAFLALGLWSFVFVLPEGSFETRQRVGVLMAFIIYYVVRRHAAQFLSHTLFLAVTVNFLAGVAQLVRPDTYAAFAPFVLRTVKDLSQGNRGLSGLSTEPSFLAAMALAHGLLAIYFYRIDRMGRRTFWSSLAMSLVMLTLSKSATGFAYFFASCAIAGVYYAFKGLRAEWWVGFLAATALVGGLVVGPLAESRGGAVLVNLYQKPSDVVADGSAQERVRCLAIGALSMLRYPGGVGGGGFAEVATEINEDLGLQSVFEVANPDVVPGVLNAGGQYLAELGVLFLLFLGFVFRCSLRLEVVHLSFCWIALVFLLFSFSITMPLTWLLLGLSSRRDFLPTRATQALTL
jgi:hypothetical protein